MSESPPEWVLPAFTQLSEMIIKGVVDGFKAIQSGNNINYISDIRSKQNNKH